MQKYFPVFLLIQYPVFKIIINRYFLSLRPTVWVLQIGSLQGKLRLYVLLQTPIILLQLKINSRAVSLLQDNYLM